MVKEVETFVRVVGRQRCLFVLLDSGSGVYHDRRRPLPSRERFQLEPQLADGQCPRVPHQVQMTEAITCPMYFVVLPLYPSVDRRCQSAVQALTRLETWADRELERDLVPSMIPAWLVSSPCFSSMYLCCLFSGRVDEVMSRVVGRVMIRPILPPSPQSAILGLRMP